VATVGLAEPVALERVGRNSGPGRSRWPRIAAAWLLGLTVVAGVGVVGRDGDRVAATEDEAPIAALATAVPITDHVIVLESPATQNATITTRTLVVRGHLPSGGGVVTIVLESSGNKTVSTQTVQPARVRGPAAPDDRSTFLATFALSNPRPGGRMVIQVIAYDPRGVPFDSVRRRIQVGAVVPSRQPDTGSQVTPPAHRP